MIAPAVAAREGPRRIILIAEQAHGRDSGPSAVLSF